MPSKLAAGFRRVMPCYVHMRTSLTISLTYILRKELYISDAAQNPDLMVFKTRQASRVHFHEQRTNQELTIGGFNSEFDLDMRMPLPKSGK